MYEFPLQHALLTCIDSSSSRGAEDAMKECLLKELETMIQLTQTTTVHSVYFGGGMCVCVCVCTCSLVNSINCMYM